MLLQSYFSFPVLNRKTQYIYIYIYIYIYKYIYIYIYIYINIYIYIYIIHIYILYIYISCVYYLRSQRLLYLMTSNYRRSEVIFLRRWIPNEIAWFQKTPEWDCMVSKNTCFQQIFTGTEKKSKEIFWL